MADQEILPGFCGIEPPEAMIAIWDQYDKERHKIMQDLARKYNIADFDEETCIRLCNVGNPLILVRGRPITREQVIQLIIGEEPLFGNGSDDEHSWPDPRCDCGALKHIFYRSEDAPLSTWVYSDGTIGGNLTLPEIFPELEDFLPMYADLSDQYPFLDMVVSFTMVDGCCCCPCSKTDPRFTGNHPCSCKDCIPYLDKIEAYRDYDNHFDFEGLYYHSWKTDYVKSDVGNSVCLTIWIHNGRSEVLFGHQAISKFNEYNTLYCAPEYAFMFGSSLYQYEHSCICDKKFVEDCFESIGQPRSLCDEYVEQEFIAPFNEDAVVITKEWVINQYNTYIAGT